MIQERATQERLRTKKTSLDMLPTPNEPENQIDLISGTVRLPNCQTHDLSVLDDLENEPHNEGAEIGDDLLGERTFAIPHAKLEHTQRFLQLPSRG
jgi:hypothetical protein